MKSQLLCITVYKPSIILLFKMEINELVNEEIIKHLPKSFQVFYHICKDAGLELEGKEGDYDESK